MKIKYSNQEEREAILEAHSEDILIAEHNHFDGKFLIFETKKENKDRIKEEKIKIKEKEIIRRMAIEEIEAEEDNDNLIT